MKIAFSTSGVSLDAPLDSRFGRAPKFLVYEINDDSYVVIDNTQNLNAAQGAGIQSAETVIRCGAQALVTGHCGPKAFRILNSAGVKIFTSGAPTVEEALQGYRDDALEALDSADVSGHWS